VHGPPGTSAGLIGCIAMDSRHQDPNNPNAHAFRGNYSFNNASQNDQFGNFLQPDHDPAFNNAWDPASFTDTQDTINTFGRGNPNWNTNTLQDSNYAAPDYGIQDRPYDQIYSRIPSSFDYSNFRSHAQQTLSTPAYDPRLGIQVPVTSQSHYTFPNSQSYQNVTTQNQTISPQALQHYPNPYSQGASSKPRQVSYESRQG